MELFLSKRIERVGWGGRIRTFTILINSEVSYRLDHAPAGVERLLTAEPKQAGFAEADSAKDIGKDSMRFAIAKSTMGLT
jgi:hypothetical protein